MFLEIKVLRTAVQKARGDRMLLCALTNCSCDSVPGHECWAYYDEVLNATKEVKHEEKT